MRITLPTYVPDELDVDAYGVTIVDDSDAPWAVTYEGAEDDLRRMVADHWPDEKFVPDEDIYEP